MVSSTSDARQDSAAKSKDGKSASSKTDDKAAAEKSGDDKKSSTAKAEPTADQQKRIKSMVRTAIKSFAAAELTSDQEQKANEMFSKAATDFIVKRDAVEITSDMQKKHAAALKSSRDKGNSVRKQNEDAFAAVALSEEQTKVFKATQTSFNKAKRDFAKQLSEEQFAKLPETMQQNLKPSK